MISKKKKKKLKLQLSTSLLYYLFSIPKNRLTKKKIRSAVNILADIPGLDELSTKPHMNEFDESLLKPKISIELISPGNAGCLTQILAQTDIFVD